MARSTRSVALARVVTPAQLKRDIRIRRADELAGPSGPNGVVLIGITNDRVMENSAPGTPVGDIFTIPAGADIELVTTGGNRFDLVGSTLVVGSTPLDHEATPVVNVLVHAEYAGSTLETTLPITILNETEVIGVTLSANTVLENSAAGVTIGTLTPNPADATLQVVGPYAGYFTVAAGNILKTGSTPTDYETAPNLTDHSYPVTIAATRQGETANFTIPVFVLNQVEITNITLSANHIAEGSGSGTVVGGLTSTPSGATFSLVDNAGSRFALAGNNVVAGSVATNYDTATQHDITVRGTIGNESLNKTFTILVDNVNSISDITLTGASVNENTAPGVTVGTFATVPPGLPLTLTDTAGNRFALSGNTLQTGATATNYEVAQSHQVTAQATFGSDTLSKNFTINVVDIDEINDITLSGNTVTENTAAGVTVGTLASVPTGATFSIISQSPAGSYFVINGNALQTGATPTDYENAISHTVNIRGTRQSETYDEAFTINVTNITEISSVSLDNLSINENSPQGTTVGNLTSSPAGASFSLTDNAGGRFQISGGVLQAGSVATNYEAATSHSVTVRGTRLGETKDQQFTISVNDLVELSTISLSGSSIDENSGPGTGVGTLSSSPAGASFSLTNSAGNRFALSGNTIVAGSVATDYETATSHQITVQGTRLGETKSQNFTISVNDVNEAPPAPDLDSFGLSGSSIDENSGAGTFVGTFSSSPSGASYVLTNSAGGRFAISGSSLVAGSTPTDYETATSHSISVQATRGATTLSDSFTITVNNLAEGGGGSPTLTPGVSNGSLTVFASNPGEQAVSGYVTVSISQGTGPYSFDWEQVSGYANMYVAYGTVNGKPNDSGYFYLDQGDRPSDRTTIWRCKVTDSVGNYGYTNNVTIRLVQSSPT
ncbi:putative cadherin-like domain protein [Caulobacter phage CcrRogue]|uniref:Putative cadherin-like domain protein n=1 Tax=Caulobacter phage CcrRogue TaxID=2927986 RepID=K4JS89_9CAUD|nr:putative cadherin-like domain protein [Caulobacter phage CcrRogue]AFU86608.1 putative cadherin-like domain protein [Caulobacter phage CcrRogue]